LGWTIGKIYKEKLPPKRERGEQRSIVTIYNTGLNETDEYSSRTLSRYHAGRGFWRKKCVVERGGIVVRKEVQHRGVHERSGSSREGGKESRLTISS